MHQVAFDDIMEVFIEVHVHAIFFTVDGVVRLV